MIKAERYNNHYDAFFANESKRQHKNIKKMSNERLFAEFDDIVQVLTLLDHADYAALSGTRPGRLYRLMLHEIKERIKNPPPDAADTGAAGLFEEK